MIERQCFYVISGPAHIPYFLVSLFTLRRQMPQLPVLVYVWPESLRFVERIADDLKFDFTLHEPDYRGKNSQFISKQVAAQDPTAEVKLYLDADTMVMRDLSALFEIAEREGFCATQFNDWTTQGIVRGRIKRLVNRDGIPQDVVAELINKPYPSVNGGVFACRPNSRVLNEWKHRTWMVRDIFIADETALHTFVPSGSDPFMGIATTDSICWNCSPIEKYMPKGLKEEDIAIWHFHGDSNVRPDKSQKGMELWMPIWLRCLRENVGFCHEWAREVVATNKHMRKLKGVLLRVK